MLIALGLILRAPLLALLPREARMAEPAFSRTAGGTASVCTILAAVSTPTPDVYNMTLMVMPLLGLYFVSFVVVYVVAAGGRPQNRDVPRTPTDPGQR